MMEPNETGAVLQPQEPEVPAPRLGFGAKLWNLFVDPRKTFASVDRNHEWVVLWILVAALSIGAYLPVKPIVKEAQIAQVEERLDQADLPAERRAEILEGVEEQFDNPLYLLFVPATQIIVLAIVAGILLFLGNILLGGNTSYLKMLNAYAWTMMVAIPATIVTVPMIVAKGSLDVSIGLGVLTSTETGPFLKKLLTSIELFGLWQVWLSSVAVSVLAKVEAKSAFMAVLGIWFVWVLAQSGLATLGIQFGM